MNYKNISIFIWLTICTTTLLQTAPRQIIPINGRVYNSVTDNNSTSATESAIATISTTVNTLISTNITSLTTDFQETWTILDAIAPSDLSPINNKLDELAQDFQETWTVLDAITPSDLAPINNKLDTILIDFQETWTVLDNHDTSLANINNKLDNISIDFQETWTVLNTTDITLSTMNTKLDTITEDLQETWTILATIFTPDLTPLNTKIDTIINDFKETWTVLEASDTNLTAINIKLNNLVTDIQETWTVLNTTDINLSAIDIKIDSITKDFQETWTVLNATDATLSIINNKLDNVSVDFQKTWTILNATDATLSTINSKFDAITDDFQETWTILEQLNTNRPVFINNSDIVPATGKITIDAPGVYQVSEDLFLSQIIIDSDNVVLNFNDFTATFTDMYIPSGINLVTGHKHITIKNGTLNMVDLSNKSGIAASATSTLDNIFIENIIINNAGDAFSFSNGTYTNIHLTNCYANLCTAESAAFYFSVSCKNLHLTNCYANSCKNGFSIFGAYGLSLDNCYTSNTTYLTGTGFGIYDCAEVKLSNCTATSSLSGTSGFFRGFWIPSDTTTNLLAYNCMATDNDSGFVITGATNLLDRCTASGNTTNFSISSGAKTYLCQDITTGGSFSWQDNVATDHPILTTIDNKLDNLANDFQETWTVLNATNATLSAMDSKLNNLAGDFQETWTVLNQLNIGQPIFICNNDINAAGIITLDTPGVYQLGEDISLTRLLINSSDVVLNLNDFTATFTTTDIDNIIIAANHTNITIKNGTIHSNDIYDCAIRGYCLSGETISNVLIENIEIINGAGIGFSSDAGGLNKNIHIKNCVAQSTLCVSFNNTTDSSIVDCYASFLSAGGGEQGFALYNSTSIYVANCIASGGFELGFTINTVTDTVFYNCTSQNNVTGFNLTGDTNLLDQCSAIENTTNYSIGTSHTSLCQDISGGIFTWQDNTSTDGPMLTAMDTKLDNLAGDFQETWTILNATNATLSSMDTKIDDISNDFQETWTILDQINPYPFIPISNQDAIAGTITITNQGSYKLCENLTDNNIVIQSSSNITLDLNDYIIDISSAKSGITITAGATDVIIQNGTINKTGGVSNNGVYVLNNTANGDIKNIFLKNIKTNGFSYGYYFYVNGAYTIKNFEINTCEAHDCTDSFYLNVANGGTIKRGYLIACCARNNSVTGNGFYLGSGSGIYLYDCVASDAATGFSIQSSATHYLLNACTAGNNTVGFALDGATNMLNECIAAGNGAGYTITAGTTCLCRNKATDGTFSWQHNIAPTP